MEMKDIIVHKCYSQNGKTTHVNLGIGKINWITNLWVTVKPYKYETTYVLTFKIDVQTGFKHTIGELSTFTEFLIHLPNFDIHTFYNTERQLMITLTEYAFNHSRILFSEWPVGDFSGLYLPLKTREQITELLAKAEIYDRI